MPKTLLKSRLFLSKNKIDYKLEWKSTKSNLSSNLQTFKQSFVWEWIYCIQRSFGFF